MSLHGPGGAYIPVIQGVLNHCCVHIYNIYTCIYTHTHTHTHIPCDLKTILGHLSWHLRTPQLFIPQLCAAVIWVSYGKSI